MISKIANLLFFFIVLLLFSCKQNDNNKSIDKVKYEITKNLDKLDTVKDIYIGKKIFAGGELYDYVLSDYKKLQNIDSLSYGVYKNEITKSSIFIFSLEKFIQNVEVEEYKIIDTIHIKNYNSKDFNIKETVSGNNVNLTVYFKNKVIKKWKFPKSININSALPVKWYGIYTVQFDDKNKDWTEQVNITLEIKKDSIIYGQAGYQSYSKYNLNGKIIEDKLNLSYLKHIDGLESAILEKTKDFGKVSYDGENYMWDSPYIDILMTDGKPKTYKIVKR